MHQIRLRLFLAFPVVLLALAACKQAPELPSVLSPYKIDIQQGNVVTQEMLSKLKAGMTRSQVRFVLGSPLVIDPFRGDRWDYVSMYQKQGKEVERRRLTVIFDDDKLIRIEGDVTLTDSSLNPPAAIEKPTAGDKPAAKPAVPVDAARVEPAKAAPPAQPAVAVPAPVKPAVKSAPDQPPAVAAKPEAAVEASKAATAPAEAVKPVEPSAADAAKPAADEKKNEVAKKEAPKEKPKPGFFGRMLDKLGI